MTRSYQRGSVDASVRGGDSTRFTRTSWALGGRWVAAFALAALLPRPWMSDATAEHQRAGARLGGTLIAAFSADPAGFDPVRGPSGMSHVVIEQIYSTLMSVDKDAITYPDLAESFAMAGATDRALDLLDRAVDEGFYPYPFIAEHCPFLAPLRGTSRFAEVSAKAQRLVSDFTQGDGVSGR